MLALMELNVSLYDFFEGSIYEQLVKTKTKQNVVEIINSKDFFDLLQRRGVRKKSNEHENLKKCLQLDPNYPQLLMLKKIAKALDEMAKNEELMSGILAAAEEDLGGQVVEDDDQQMDGGEKVRLNTIGEDEEDKQFDTNKSKRGQLHNQGDDYEEDNYDDDEENYGGFDGQEDDDDDE